MKKENKKSEYRVKIKTGKIGRTYHSEELIKGKQIVHIEEDGKNIKLLCNPNTLEVIGFID